MTKLKEHTWSHSRAWRWRLTRTSSDCSPPNTAQLTSSLPSGLCSHVTSAGRPPLTILSPLPLPVPAFLSLIPSLGFLPSTYHPDTNQFSSLLSSRLFSSSALLGWIRLVHGSLSLWVAGTHEKFEISLFTLQHFLVGATPSQITVTFISLFILLNFLRVSVSKWAKNWYMSCSKVSSTRAYYFFCLSLYLRLLKQWLAWYIVGI